MRYIALLRGINVGGKNMVKMEPLRELLSGMGFGKVASYVNSGNLAFDTKKTDDHKLAMLIHDAFEKEFGFDVTVMVRSADEIRELIANNPYEGQFQSHKDLHVFFLAEELSSEHQRLLLEKNSDVEMISVKGREIYYLLRISIIDSILGKGFIDKKLKIPATARNWRTVQKLAEF
jgi:uncharacterized protein (DUF1697 family)